MVSVQFIRDQARKTLKEFEITTPPVPVRDIIEGHSLKIEEVDGSENYEGELIPEQRKIRLNRQRPLTSQRFTLAHELGHWVLYHKERLFDDGDEVGGIYDTRSNYEARIARYNPTGKRDGEANEFAVELLMPTKWVKAHWKEHKDVGKLAVLYKVSQEAMWIRISELRLL